jgi:parallel beta-helix repeat protein
MADLLKRDRTPAPRSQGSLTQRSNRRLGVCILLVAAIVGSISIVGYGLIAVVGDRSGRELQRSVSTVEGLDEALGDAREAGGGKITLTSSVYRIRHGLDVPANVTIDGRGARLLVLANSPGAVTVNASAGLVNVDVVGRGRIPTLLLVPTGAREVTISGCRLLGMGQGQTGILVQPSTDNVTLNDISISGVKNAITLNDPHNVSMKKLRVRNWTTHGIWAVASEGNTAENITVDGANIGPNTGHGRSRYPILFVASSERIRNIVIRNSTVRGPGTAYELSRRPGTADQISVMGAVGVTIEGNSSVGGGERGINVTSSSDVIVRNNVVSESDASGLGIGSLGAGKGNDNVKVYGNTVKNCGLSRLGPHATPQTERTGIRVVQVNRGTVTDNRVTVSPGALSHPQTFGITVYRNRDVSLLRNVMSGPMLERVLRNAG